MTRISSLFLSALALTLLTLGCVTAQAKDGGKTASTDKTLVSWVTTSDRSLAGGSVLTVQEEDKFDGIVFAELAPARWMAGSNFYRRTNKNQRNYAEEEADAATIVQLAMVYKGDRILLYRNGELYASQKRKT